MPEAALDDSVSVSYLGAGSAHSLALVNIPSGSIVVSWGRGEDGKHKMPNNGTWDLLQVPSFHHLFF